MAEMKCSIGVMAYNEQANVADALSSILEQTLTAGEIAELIVVASGCEDQTAAIVSDIARRDSRVRLVEQERREGKASAVNLFISQAQSDILVMVSADVILEHGSLNHLLRHFEDEGVGMVGGHPRPVNDETTFLGHAVHLQWRLHDRIARHSPKLGEIVAFRNVVPGIPLDTAVDEVSIQGLINQLGYRLVYEPRAVIYNRGPSTLRDFLRQRRRIYAGHLRIREQQNFAAPTMNVLRIARALWGSGSFRTPRTAMWSAGTVGLEAVARLLGGYDVVRRRSQHVWDVCDTTKQHIAAGARAQGQHNVAVFHILDFHSYQIEVGRRGSRQLMRAAAEHIKRGLGSNAIITIQQSGTIIALLSGDRETAENAARDLVQQFVAQPPRLSGRGTAALASATLACGFIAFSQAGPPLARPIPPMIEVLSAPSIP